MLLAPYVRDFIDENKIRDQWNWNNDVYGHTNLLQDQSCTDDFVIPLGIDDESELRWLLEKAMDGRHAVCHDEYANIIDKRPICEEYRRQNYVRRFHGRGKGRLLRNNIRQLKTKLVYYTTTGDLVERSYSAD
jgi:hypothetical protein